MHEKRRPFEKGYFSVIVIAALAAFSLAAPHQALAALGGNITQEVNIERPAESAAPIALEPVSVTAEKKRDRTPAGAKIAPNHELFTHKLETAKIEAQKPATLSEAVKFMSPNVFVGATNRKLKRIFAFRGANVSISLDGFLLQDGNANYSGIRADERMLDFLCADIVESVELVKDSTALTLGPLSGGLFVIKTKRPAAKHASIRLDAGTFGFFNSRLTASDSIGKRSAYFVSAGQKNFEGPSGINANESNRNLFVKLFYDPTPSDKLTFTHSHDIGMYQTPLDRPDYSQLNAAFANATSRLNLTPQTARSFDPWINLFTDLGYSKKWSAKNETELQLTRLEVRNDFHNPRGTLPNPVGHIDGHHVFETTSAMALRHVMRPSEGLTLRAGYINDHYYNPTGKFWWEYMNNEDTRHSTYFTAEKAVDAKLTLDAGVRRDRRYIASEQRARFKVGQKYNFIRDKWEDPRNNYSAGATYRPDAANAFSLRYGRFAVTPPDRYASFDGSALRDERDTLVNAGYERKFKAWKRTAGISLNLFRNDMSDAIIEDTRTKYADAAKTVITRIFLNQSTIAKGFELNLNAAASNNFSFSLGAGKTSFSPAVATKPETTYNFRLDYDDRSGTNYSLFGRYMGGFMSSVSLVTGKDAAGKNVETLFPYSLGKFWDIGFGAKRELGRVNGNACSVSLAVKNLLDKKYETEALAPDFGRTFTLGWEMEF